ncbi:MAG: NifB/NifX family molybdenum-iron cluster-binding protein [Promethearchaeota archaeon]
MSPVYNLKLAIPSTNSEGLTATVTTRFGRCPAFTIVNLKDNEIEEVSIVDNAASGARGGAGPMAAQLIAEEGVKCIIGGYYGPNATNALLQGNIRMFGPSTNPSITVKELVEEFLAEKLEEISSATSPGHV